jgi:hypothetical protein
VDYVTEEIEVETESVEVEIEPVNVLLEAETEEPDETHETAFSPVKETEEEPAAKHENFFFEEPDFDPGHALALEELDGDQDDVEIEEEVETLDVEEPLTAAYELNEFVDLEGETIEEDDAMAFAAGEPINPDEVRDEDDDTLWPPIEGDGFVDFENDFPRATLHETSDEEEDD